MVRGLFFKFDFPLVHFSTEGVTSDQLYPIAWEGIRIIESTGLKVIAVTADGASPNRKFFRMHGDGTVYKTSIVHASDERDVYFYSDLPHLIKTTRNCFSHSDSASTNRAMWVSMCVNMCAYLQCRLLYTLSAYVLQNNGKEIEWCHMKRRLQIRL